MSLDDIPASCACARSINGKFVFFFSACGFCEAQNRSDWPAASFFGEQLRARTHYVVLPVYCTAINHLFSWGNLVENLIQLSSFQFHSAAAGDDNFISILYATLKCTFFVYVFRFYFISFVLLSFIFLWLIINNTHHKK